jgi:2-oxoisovalerate dehydrogenase E2 component (dihydrolipoyl transacylase)
VERVFVMPDLGEGLEEGTIVEWLVAAGDQVALNQPLVEVETAKAAVEIPSPFAGTVATLHGDAGQDVPVGAPLVTFEVDGEAVTAPGTASLAASPLGPDGPGSPSPPPDRGVVAYGMPNRSARAKATPPVRKLAKELGVDLQTVAGSGQDGRITEDDVRRAKRLDGVVGVSVSLDALGLTRIDVDGVRASVASAMEEQARVPQVTTFRTVDCSALEAFRTERDVSPLPVVIAALCRTVRDHPLLNAHWAETTILAFDQVNVGVAVDTERGLVVPVLRKANGQGIGQLQTEIRRLAAGARAGTLPLDDVVGPATIAVSNTGSYGSEAGTPILSPGTSVTLALGVIQSRALVVDGEVVARPAATISLTFDHRVLDGATVGRALTDLVALLESPERLGGLPR